MKEKKVNLRCTGKIETQTNEGKERGLLPLAQK